MKPNVQDVQPPKTVRRNIALGSPVGIDGSWDNI